MESNAPVINPSAVFTLETARRALGLKKNCLPREVRLRRLRAAKRAGQYFILGEWLLEWLINGEIHRAVPPPITERQSDVQNDSRPVTLLYWQG